MTFEVQVTHTTTYKILVEAADIEEACNKAQDNQGEMTYDHDVVNYDITRMVE